MLRGEPLALDFEHILRLAKFWCLGLECLWLKLLSCHLCLGTVHDLSQSGPYCFPFLMGILILPLLAWFLSFFFISITPWSFPCRGIRVTIVSFLEEQRLDEREKFSGLWSLNVPGQSSVVWHLWDALDPRGCLCGLRVLYLTSPIFSIIFCTLPIAFVSSVAF